MDGVSPQNKTALRRPVTPIPQQQEMAERISKMMGFLFIVVAFCLDLFEMLLEWLGIGILGLSSLISVCASLAFWIWFKMHNIPFSGKPKNVTRFGLTSVLEIIPGLDAIFGFVWTVGIFALVGSVMEEDGQSGIIVTIYQHTLKKIGL